MTAVRNLALGFILSVPIAIPMQAQTLQTVFNSMNAVAPKVKTISADIRRDNHTAIVNDDSMQNGTIKLKRDKGETRALMEFTGPNAQSIAFQGAIASVYYPKINTQDVYDLGAKKGLVDKYLLLGFGVTAAELQAEYDVTWIGAEPVSGQPAGHIQLIPKSKDVQVHLKKAELWIGDNGLPVQQRIVTSNSGDFMLVTYSNLKLNPPLSDSSLKLTLPKGVKTEHPQF